MTIISDLFYLAGHNIIKKIKDLENNRKEIAMEDANIINNGTDNAEGTSAPAGLCPPASPVPTETPATRDIGTVELHPYTTGVQSSAATIPPPKVQADRYNEGKLEYSMLDLTKMAECVKMLMYGAKKYTKITPFTFENKDILCQQLRLAGNVIKISLLNPKECVGLVTISPLDLLQSVPFVKKLEGLKPKICAQHVEKKCELQIVMRPEKKLENTNAGIEPSQSLELKSGNEIKNDRPAPGILSGNQEENFSADSQNMGLQSSSTIISAPSDAGFAGQQLTHTLTTVTLPDFTEVSFVVSATSALACLTIILDCLQKLSVICNYTINNNNIQISGKNNWKRGMNTSAILDSLLRHIAAVQSGEVIDPESGVSHLGAIQCNALFLGNINNTQDVKVLPDDK